MLQGVPLRGAASLKEEKVILVFYRQGLEKCKNKAELPPPQCRPCEKCLTKVQGMISERSSLAPPQHLKRIHLVKAGVVACHLFMVSVRRRYA